MAIIPAWWNQTRSRLKKSEAKLIRKAPVFLRSHFTAALNSQRLANERCYSLEAGKSMFIS